MRTSCRWAAAPSITLWRHGRPPRPRGATIAHHAQPYITSIRP